METLLESRTGIRELKARLSAYLQRVRAGETVVVTDRGVPVARIVPVAVRASERIRPLVDAGLVEWDGTELEDRAPVARVRGETTVSDLLLADRE